MCTLHDFSVLKSNLFIRALLLDRILVTEKTTRTPRVHLVYIKIIDIVLLRTTFRGIGAYSRMFVYCAIWCVLEYIFRERSLKKMYMII